MIYEIIEGPIKYQVSFVKNAFDEMYVSVKKFSIIIFSNYPYTTVRNISIVNNQIDMSDSRTCALSKTVIEQINKLIKLKVLL